MPSVGGNWDETRQVIGLKGAEFKLELLAAGDALHGGPAHSQDVRQQARANMPVDLNGYWKMISNEHFEDYMKALGESADLSALPRRVTQAAPTSLQSSCHSQFSSGFSSSSRVCSLVVSPREMEHCDWTRASSRGTRA